MLTTEVNAKKHNTKKYIFILFCSLFPAYTVIEQLLIKELQLPLLASMFYIATILLFFWNYDRIIKTVTWEYIFCGLFALVTVVSESFRLTNSLSYLFGNIFNEELVCQIFQKEADMAQFLLGNIGKGITVLAAIARTIGWFFISLWGIATIHRVFDYFFIQSGESKVTSWLLGKHSILRIFLVISLLWLPYFIIKLPGSCSTDASAQIAQVFGEIPLNNYNPLGSTLFLGGLVWVGTQIWNFSFGIFLCTLTQMELMALIFALCIYEIRNFKVGQNYIIGLVAFVGLSPFFGNSATSIGKDSLYCSLFALFILRIIVLIRKCKNRSLRLADVGYLAAVGFFMSCFRHNGVYSLIPVVFLLIIVICKEKTQRKVAAICILLSSVILVMGVNFIQKNVLNVTQSSKAELLSIPFQQTARYVSTYPDDVTNEERSIIDSVLDFDNLGTLYNPYVSDPVKGTYKGDDSKLGAYFRVWFSQMLRHPKCYLESFINLTYPAFYFDKSNLRSYSPYTFEGEQYSQFNCFSKLRILLLGYSVAFSFIPVISQLVNPVLYVWVLIYLLIYVFSKRDKIGVIILIPLFITLVGVLGGPAVINHPRYLYPIAWSVPFIIPYFIDKNSPSV